MITPRYERMVIYIGLIICSLYTISCGPKFEDPENNDIHSAEHISYNPHSSSYPGNIHTGLPTYNQNHFGTNYQTSLQNDHDSMPDPSAIPILSAFPFFCDPNKYPLNFITSAIGCRPFLKAYAPEIAKLAYPTFKPLTSTKVPNDYEITTWSSSRN